MKVANIIAPGRIAGIVRDFRLYITVGCGAAIIDYSVYFLLANCCGIHPVSANAVSRPMGGLFGFVGNRQLTFRGRGRAHASVQFARFWVVWGLSFGLTELLIWLFHDGFQLGVMVSKLGAECAALLFNFMMQRHWAFH